MQKLIVCFAGLDGSGKTTQAQLASEWMNENGFPTEFIRFHTEPTKAEKQEIVVKTTQYLIAKRLALSVSDIEFIKEGIHIQKKMDEIIFPAIQSSKSLVLDRYLETYDAYQSVIGKNKNWVREINKNLPQPDLFFLLDVPPEVCFQRIKRSGRRIGDHETIHTLHKSREFYISHQDDYSFVILDGNRPPEKVLEEVILHIQKRIENI